jgi:hypothetical protein
MLHQEPIANLGDVDFMEHGGRLVFRDTEDGDRAFMEIVEPPIDESEGPEKWTIYRFDLDRLRLVEKDRTFYLVALNWDETWPHPLHHYDEWFHDSLDEVANFVGANFQDLRVAFTSENPVERAWAWDAVVSHYGPFELDQYPLSLGQHEAFNRYGLGDECECPECSGGEE